MNTVPPLDARRVCEWSLHDHIQITGAPLVNLTGGANDDEAGPSGSGGGGKKEDGDDEAGPSGGGSGGYTVKEEDYDAFYLYR